MVFADVEGIETQGFRLHGEVENLPMVFACGTLAPGQGVRPIVAKRNDADFHGAMTSRPDGVRSKQMQRGARQYP